MAGKTSVARYLFDRLYQQGVRHLFGVPGDFTLRALDHAENAGLKWIGNCNELNAGYAADGYARIKGLGALITTFGVGELSAINAVAGSFSEHVPVVHIVGTPARHLYGNKQQRTRVHHTLTGRHMKRPFPSMYRHTTSAQLNLADSGDAPQQIDDTIQTCMWKRKPVYIELPSNVVENPISNELLATPLATTEPLDRFDKSVHAVSSYLLNQLNKAHRPVLLIDRGYGIDSIREAVNEFARVTKIPTLTLPSGAGMIDTSVENYYGVHAGPVGQIDTMPLIENCDLCIEFGNMLSDTQTLSWSILPREPRISITRKYVARHPTNVELVLSKVAQEYKYREPSSTQTLSIGDFRSVVPKELDPLAPIEQTNFYLKLNSFFRPDDLILLANATPIIGGRDFILPPHAKVVASGMWFSVGHMLPAALGAALAKDRGRTILFDGDGSFQATAQELSTIIWKRLDMTIFIINNGGYGYERHIHGMDADYNSIAPWNYLEAPKFFSAPEGYKIEAHRLETWADLDNLLSKDSFHDGKGLKLVEVVFGKYDIPEKFRPVFKKAGEHL